MAPRCMAAAGYSVSAVTDSWCHASVNCHARHPSRTTAAADSNLDKCPHRQNALRTWENHTAGVSRCRSSRPTHHQQHPPLLDKAACSYPAKDATPSEAATALAADPGPWQQVHEPGGACDCQEVWLDACVLATNLWRHTHATHNAYLQLPTAPLLPVCNSILCLSATVYCMCTTVHTAAVHYWPPAATAGVWPPGTATHVGNDTPLPNTPQQSFHLASVACVVSTDHQPASGGFEA